MNRVSVLIRDDGLKDDTIDIIEEYMRMYPNISLVNGSNCGSGYWKLSYFMGH